MQKYSTEKKEKKLSEIQILEKECKCALSPLFIV